MSKTCYNSKSIALVMMAAFLITNCQKETVPSPTKPSGNVDLPTVSTSTPSSITAVSANGGGIISNDGGSAIVEKGLVWSTTGSPTVSLSSKTSNGAGTGLFSSVMTGLSPNTTYFVRAYGSNSAGVAYGNEITFKTLADPNADVYTLTSKTNVSNGLVGKIHLGNEKIDFSLIGSTDATGKIIKVSGLSLSKSTSPDTTINFTFDKDMRVKLMFISVKGAKPATIVRVSHQPPSILYTGYTIHPLTNLATLKEQMAFSDTDNRLKSQLTYRVLETDPEQARLALDAGLTVLGAVMAAGGLDIVAATAALTLGPVILGVAGVAIYMIGYNDLKKYQAGYLDAFDALRIKIGQNLISKAEGAEFNPSDYALNPSEVVNNIDVANAAQNQWNWCPCSFSWPFEKYPMNISYSDGGSPNYSGRKDLYVSVVDVSGLCTGTPGKSVQVWGGLNFLLKPGTTATFFGNVTYSPTCTSGGSSQVQQTFTCSN